MPRERSRAPRLLGFAVISAASVVLAGACSDLPGPKTPSLDLTYAPSPPVPGERLAIRMTGSNLGVVDLFQGSVPLARVVNPLDGVVPDDFYVYSAKNAEPPRAVALDAQGNRIEVAGRPGGVVVPKPVADGGTEATSFTTTCRGFTDVTAVPSDAGTSCGPSGALVTLTMRNATGGILDVYGTLFEAGVCKTVPLARIAANEDRAISGVFDNQTLTLQKEDATLVSRLRIAAGEAGPCNLLVP